MSSGYTALIDQVPTWNDTPPFDATDDSVVTDSLLENCLSSDTAVIGHQGKEPAQDVETQETSDISANQDLSLSDGG